MVCVVDVSWLWFDNLRNVVTPLWFVIPKESLPRFLETLAVLSQQSCSVSLLNKQIRLCTRITYTVPLVKVLHGGVGELATRGMDLR